MKKAEYVAVLAWMGVGGLFCASSVGLGLGKAGEPGPGFFPLLMSICLMAFSLVQFLLTFTRRRQSALAAGGKFWPETEGLKKILLTVLSLLVYIVALSYLGFLLTTLLFLIFSLRVVDPQRWSTVCLISGLTTVLAYAVFHVWLKANLPGGFWGF